jgi:bifunctional NMN adenylyltransferase/nudix hydrolase
MQDLVVYVGRFQPFHRGHLSVIIKAFQVSKRVLVLVGSANEPRSLRNPFTFDERKDMILSCLNDEQRSVIDIQGLENSLYNDDLWVTNVQSCVAAAYEHFFEGWKGLADTKALVSLIGHSKDNSSFYLKLFPQWGSIEVPNFFDISSTEIRKGLFKKYEMGVNPFPGNKHLKDYVPDSVADAVSNYFIKTKEYKSLVEENEFITNYKKQWENSPYPPTFVTVDAVVTQSGHILLIKRKSEPGKGLWALPGGFIGKDEKIVDSMIRELREETKIKIPAPVLKGSIVKSSVFDDPNRSMRGRTITHAYHIALPHNTELPYVKGSDDADKAKWWPLSEVKREMMYEDHLDIILNMVV